MSQGHIYIYAPSNLKAVQYIIAKIPDASLLDSKTLEKYKCLEKAITQAHINKFNP